MPAKPTPKKRPTPANAKWDNTYYVTIYELSKAGLTEKEIADQLGVAFVTLRRWKESDPAVADAWKRGRTTRKAAARTDELSFGDYVYKQLPPHLQDLWDEIMFLEHEPNGVVQIETMLADQGKRARQWLFVHSLIETRFNISRSLRRVNTSRKTFESWVREEPDFAELMQEVGRYKGDFFEQKFIDLVNMGSEPATIHANKTYNRDRGYGERLDVHMSGTIDHNHVVLRIDDLKLPLETRIELRDAIRAAQPAIVDGTAKPTVSAT